LLVAIWSITANVALVPLFKVPDLANGLFAKWSSTVAAMVVDRRGDGRRPTLSLAVLHLHRRLERHDPPVGTRRRQLILRRNFI